MKRKFFVVGNVLVESDSLALRLLPHLRKRFPCFEFLELDPNEDIEEEEVNIIDVAVGIDKVMLIDDINIIDEGRVYSMHDFGIGMQLKILKELGKVRRVNIIAIPYNMHVKEALDGVIKEIERLSDRNERCFRKRC